MTISLAFLASEQKRHFCLPESPISKPPNRPLLLEIQLPGTEFLDAETGGQKSTLETADVHRDRKSGDDTGEIPVETASLESPTKCAVCEDWMVVCAVRYEPVSLLFGQYQGDFGKKQRAAGLKRQKALQHSGFRALAQS